MVCNSVGNEGEAEDCRMTDELDDMKTFSQLIKTVRKFDGHVHRMNRAIECGQCPFTTCSQNTRNLSYKIARAK